MKNDDLINDRKKYEQGWKGGLPETPCGYGSKLNQTVIQREALTRWIRETGSKTIADIGCGDLNWIDHLDMAGAHYNGLDLVPRDPRVAKFDVITDRIPNVDMVWCIWLLNHLPEPEARHVIAKLVYAPAKYLVYTWECRMFDFLNVKPIDSVVIRKAKDRSRAEYGDVELRLVKL